MKFELTVEQMKKFNDWREAKKLSNDAFGLVGGGYTFCFTPTGIGVIEKVKCDDGTELDLTDYENW